MHFETSASSDREPSLRFENGVNLPTPHFSQNQTTARKILELAIIPFSIFVILISVLVVLTFQYGRDQAVFAVVAREILAHRIPYRDVFDIKPPGIYIIYAIARAIFGPTQTGIRILEAVAMIISSLGLIRLTHLHFGDRRIGFLAAAIASQIHAQFDFWCTAQAESFGGTFTILGIVAATGAAGIGRQNPAHPGTRAALWFLTGIFFGFAGLLKPPLAGGGLVVAITGALYAYSGHNPSRKQTNTFGQIVQPIIGTALGGIFPFLLVIGWFYSKGALYDFYQALFVFTPGYTKLSWENRGILELTYYGIRQWFMGYSSVLFGGIIALFVMRPLKRDLPFVLVIATLICVHIAGVIMQAKFFPYHWSATIPLTALLAAIGWMKLARWASDKGVIFALLAFVVFETVTMMQTNMPGTDSTFLSQTLKRFELFVIGPLDPVKRDGLASFANVNMANNKLAAQYINSHTKPNDPVFIWGFECIIYDLTNRPLASRFIFDVPQRAAWSSTSTQKELINDLQKSDPAMIVIEHNDIFSYVTGNNLDSAQSLANFPAFQKLIKAHYKKSVTIGDLDLYSRVG